MKHTAALLATLLVAGLGAQVADRPTIERLDPDLDRIISVESKLELLSDRFGITEGPLWIKDGPGGYLLFSDVPANVIYKWTPNGQLSVFLDKSGYTGTDILNVGAQSTSGRLPVIVLGSNGLALDARGNLLVCTHGDRNIYRLGRDGTRTVVADRYDGKRFNGPNDLVLKSNGALYFTDGTGGLRGRERSPARELFFNGLFLVRDGKVQALERVPDGMAAPNGIALSPDEKVLYAGHTGKIWRYDIQPDDTVANPRVVIESRTDGMKVDRFGNLYLTSGGGVLIVSPSGKRLGMIHPPKDIGNTTTNVAFGDADAKTLYITARTHLYKIRLNVPGARQATP
jgi:gluconolactonase